MLSFHSLGLAVENKKLFCNISMTFLPSSIIYVRGKNGSGKTSLLRTLAGINPPSFGSVTFGKKSISIAELNKPYCTYIGHKLAIKPELTVVENLEFWAKIYNSSMLVDAAILYFSMEDIAYSKCYELSAGNQKKVALSKLLACPSKLWLLDEVDSNLDSKNKELLLNIITLHANTGGITFITSHNSPEIKSAQILDLSDYEDKKI